MIISSFLSWYSRTLVAKWKFDVCKCVCVCEWNTGNAVALMEENANYVVVDDANYSMKNVISLFLDVGHYLHATEMYGISFEDKKISNGGDDDANTFLFGILDTPV